MQASATEEERILEDFFQPYSRLLDWEVDELKFKMTLLEKRILKMKHCESKSFHMIGQILNLPRPHVEKIHQHLVERLKRYRKLMPSQFNRKYQREREFSRAYCHRCGAHVSGCSNERYCMNCGWDEVTDPTEFQSNVFYGVQESSDENS